MHANRHHSNSTVIPSRDRRSLITTLLLAIGLAVPFSCSGLKQSSSTREAQSDGTEGDSTIQTQDQNQSGNNDSASVPEIVAGSYLIQQVSKTQDPAMLRVSVNLVKDRGQARRLRIFSQIANQLSGFTWFLTVDGAVQEFKGNLNLALAEQKDDMSWLVPLRNNRSVPAISIALRLVARDGSVLSVDKNIAAEGSLVTAPPANLTGSSHILFTTRGTYPPLNWLRLTSDVPTDGDGRLCQALVAAVTGQKQGSFDAEQWANGKANAICQCEAAKSTIASIRDKSQNFTALVYNGSKVAGMLMWAAMFRYNFPKDVVMTNGLIVAKDGNLLPYVGADRTTSWGSDNSYQMLHSLDVDQSGASLSSEERVFVQTGFPYFGPDAHLDISANCTSSFSNSMSGVEYMGVGNPSAIGENAFYSAANSCSDQQPVRYYCISP